MDPYDLLELLAGMVDKNVPVEKAIPIWEDLTQGLDLSLDVQQEVAGIVAGKRNFSNALLDKGIRSYVLAATGYFSRFSVASWFDARGEAKRRVQKVLDDLVIEGMITAYGTRDGDYRLVDKNEYRMNLMEDMGDPLHIHLPLLLSTMCELFPKNVVLISGEKDAGKTCAALNIAFFNRDTWKVHYFNSEMSTRELQKRLLKFPQHDYPLHEWLKINWHTKAKNFEDLIDPNGLNIIDFLEVGGEAYLVTEDIRRAFDKLDQGILVIVMQKRSYKEFAVGGEGTLEKARLAINLEHAPEGGNIARITVAKNWTGLVNPRGKVCKYKIRNGGTMELVGKWYDPDKKEASGAKTRPGGYGGVTDKDFVRERVDVN